MIKEDIEPKLNDVLQRFNMDANQWSEFISNFREKLYLLFETNSYNKLLKALFSSNDLNEFNSYGR